MSVALTDGEFATAVFISPCTIQGWRPFSVSSQPAVFIKNGVTTAQTDRRRNHLERSRVPLRISQAPQRANAATSVAR